jgi:hypothetical protein
MGRSEKPIWANKLGNPIRDNPHTRLRQPNSLEQSIYTIGSYLTEDGLEMPRKLREILSAKRILESNSKKSASSKCESLSKFRQTNLLTSKCQDKRDGFAQPALSISDNIGLRPRNRDLELIDRDYQEKVDYLYRHSTRTWAKRKR